MNAIGRLILRVQLSYCSKLSFDFSDIELVLSIKLVAQILAQYIATIPIVLVRASVTVRARNPGFSAIFDSTGK